MGFLMGGVGKSGPRDEMEGLAWCIRAAFGKLWIESCIKRRVRG